MWRQGGREEISGPELLGDSLGYIQSENLSQKEKTRNNNNKKNMEIRTRMMEVAVMRIDSFQAFQIHGLGR